ncbi:MAG: SOS response-associated peptidase [Alphaproteobacteria bacterium]
MCGRYSLTTPPEAMRGFFKITGPLPNLAPRYNLAPTQTAPIVRPADDGNEMVPARWGLVPSWSEGPESGYSLINARAETVADKPAFRGAFRARRCLVPADGFYEWQARDKRPKQPYHIHLRTRAPLAFAGLWENWEKEGERILSFAIIVTEANAMMREIHDRMPVILSPDDFDRWLDAETAGPDAQALLKPCAADLLVAEPVGTRVNNPKNDDAGCIEPLAAAAR